MTDLAFLFLPKWGKNAIISLSYNIFKSGSPQFTLYVLCGLYWNSQRSVFLTTNVVSFIFRLQDRVRETIEALRMAGIKVWVLTGDKHETAVSVSLSCGHFHRTMNILELINQKSDSQCAEQLRQLARRWECNYLDHEFRGQQTMAHGSKMAHCLMFIAYELKITFIFSIGKKESKEE